MTKSGKSKEEWTPCPPGTLSAFAGQEQGRRRREFLIRAGSTVGVIAVASVAGWRVFCGSVTPTEPTPGGIACSKVHELAPKFILAQLDEVLTRQIKAHLELCADCRKLLESMPLKSTAGLSHGEASEYCHCSTCRGGESTEVVVQLSSRSVTPPA